MRIDLMTMTVGDFVPGACVPQSLPRHLGLILRLIHTQIRHRERSRRWHPAASTDVDYGRYSKRHKRLYGETNVAFMRTTTPL